MDILCSCVKYVNVKYFHITWLKVDTYVCHILYNEMSVTPYDYPMDRSQVFSKEVPVSILLCFYTVISVHIYFMSSSSG